MSNALYDQTRYNLLTAALNWLTVDLRLVIWGGVPSFVKTDKKIADIVARGYTMRGVSQDILQQSAGADGTAKSGNVIVPLVPIGANITWMTLTIGTVPASADLVMFIDQANDLPFVPNGLDMLVTPDWAAGRAWFKP